MNRCKKPFCRTGFFQHDTHKNKENNGNKNIVLHCFEDSENHHGKEPRSDSQVTDNHGYPQHDEWNGKSDEQSRNETTQQHNNQNFRA